MYVYIRAKSSHGSYLHKLCTIDNSKGKFVTVGISSSANPEISNSRDIKTDYRLVGVGDDDWDVVYKTVHSGEGTQLPVIGAHSRRTETNFNVENKGVPGSMEPHYSSR